MRDDLAERLRLRRRFGSVNPFAAASAAAAAFRAARLYRLA